MGKKDKVITFRTEEWVKSAIEEIAQQNKWTPASTVEEIIKQYIANPYPGEITVKSEELVSVTKDLIETDNIQAVELSISLELNEDKTDIQKKLFITGLECGGRGALESEIIDEMTEEEILNIP